MISKKLMVYNGYLAFEDEEPFYYLGDTAWSLFHRLSLEEAKYYLDTRKKQGFNVIQAVCLSEHDGLGTPNFYGEYPLGKNESGLYDPTLINEKYWEHIDRVIALANERDLFVALLPTWGDKYFKLHGVGPEIFTPENAYAYGKLVGERYKDQPNIIWMLGGDRTLIEQVHRDIIDQMAAGIKSVDGDTHLVTFHPSGARSSVEDVRYRDYIDFHTIQSGHDINCYDGYKMLQSTKNAEEKPFMDAEPRYEDHPACFRPKFGYFWDAADVRQNLYWNIMEGACGNTYGNHAIWPFNAEPTEYYPYTWQEALTHVGASEAQYAKALRLSRPYFEFRAAPELVEEQDGVMSHIAAGRGDDYGFVYSPLGLPVKVFLSHFSGTAIRCAWFDPRTGEEKPFAVVPTKTTVFVPPTSGKGQDWVLVLDVLLSE